MTAPRIKLVKVLVQPVFVLDHGDRVSEPTFGEDEQGKPITSHPVVTVPADEWPDYSGVRFPREVRDWQRIIDAEHAKAQPRRVRRRAK